MDRIEAITVGLALMGHSSVGRTPMDCGGIQCGSMDPHGSIHLRSTLLLSEEVPDRSDGV